MLPSEFEAGLLPSLKQLIPDLTAEKIMKGRGKTWRVDLYSEAEKLAIEASSRNITRNGKSKSSIQHYDKFYAMALKLIDIRASSPRIKAVMLWKDHIPAYSTDLRLCSEWGLFVMSHRNFDIRRVLSGESPGSVNKSSVDFLIRRKEDAAPRWRWLAEERKKEIAAMLQSNAMALTEIERTLGMQRLSGQSRISDMLQHLVKEGKVMKLTPGYVRGYGAVYGTSAGQLQRFDAEHLDEYKSHKRRKQLAEMVLSLLKEDGTLGYREIQQRLQTKWKVQVGREELVGILNMRLVRKGLVLRAGLPKRLVYSAASSS